MKRDLIIYHGSQQIIETPKFGIGKKYNDYGHCRQSDRAFIVRKISSLQRNGLVP